MLIVVLIVGLATAVFAAWVCISTRSLGLALFFVAIYVLPSTYAIFRKVTLMQIEILRAGGKSVFPFSLIGFGGRIDPPFVDDVAFLYITKHMFSCFEYLVFCCAFWILWKKLGLRALGAEGVKSRKSLIEFGGAVESGPQEAGSLNNQETGR